jgi:alpha-beta hydrolase superfamily lysophospholipase
MVAIHGLSGAALDYEPLGSELRALGFATYAPELRGQGNDPLPGRRGDLDSLETWFSDLRAFFALVRSKHPGVPVFYYGESMGAAILTRFLAQASAEEQPAGLILASPVVVLQERLPFWLNVIFRTLLVVWPKYRLDLRPLAKRDKEPRLVTRDEEHRAWYAGAPHKLDVFTLRFFKQLGDLIHGCLAAATRLRLPVLVLYAGNDVFIRPALVETFFDALASPDKERTLYPESFHLLLHDHDCAEVLARVAAWFKPRLAGQVSARAKPSEIG